MTKTARDDRAKVLIIIYPSFFPTADIPRWRQRRPPQGSHRNCNQTVSIVTRARDPATRETQGGTDAVRMMKSVPIRSALLPTLEFCRSATKLARQHDVEADPDASEGGGHTVNIDRLRTLAHALRVRLWLQAAVRAMPPIRLLNLQQQTFERRCQLSPRFRLLHPQVRTSRAMPPFVWF